VLRRSKLKRYQRYVNIFDDLGRDWEAIVNARNTQKEADFVNKVISRRGLVLDLCCGTGRHSIALRERGWNVIGMDLSRNLLTIAKLKIERAEVKMPLVRADMRFLPFRDRVFKAVINMFTSFGYLPSESEDAISLLEVNRTLRGGGKFLLDLANRDHIVKTFRERDWAEFEPFFLLERRSLDLKGSRLTSQWTFIQKDTGQVRSIEHNVRLFTIARVEQLLNEAGLMVQNVYGGYEKQEFALEASRMIVLAERPA